VTPLRQRMLLELQHATSRHPRSVAIWAQSSSLPNIFIARRNSYARTTATLSGLSTAGEEARAEYG
jgi:hypothetical protein